MSGTQLAVLAANGLFVFALGTIGIRLLLISRRTRELPELCLGIGFCSIVAGIPTLAAAGIGRGVVGDIDAGLAAVGIALLWTSIVGQTAFTWRSFRPDATWAAAFVAAVALVEAIVCAGAIASIQSSDPASSAFAATKPAFFWLRIPMGLGYVWTCTEAMRNFRMATRRDALGIGDPVVRNRFLLWFLASGSGLCSVVVSSILHLRGMGPTSDPVAASVMATCGAFSAATLYLVFLPPHAYVRWVGGQERPSEA